MIKRLKIVWLISFLSIIILSGCGPEFTGGFASGVAAGEIAHKAENDLLKAVTYMNSETERINTAADNIKGSVKEFKGQEKNPYMWAALGSMLVNAFAGGRVYTNRKK